MILTWFISAWLVVLGVELLFRFGVSCGEEGASDDERSNSSAPMGRPPVESPATSRARPAFSIEVGEMEQIAAWMSSSVRHYHRGLVSREQLMTTAAFMAHRLEAASASKPASTLPSRAQEDSRPRAA